jgi:hypothetical protein
MIARIRGEHDTRWGRWRPAKAREIADDPARKTAPVAERQSSAEAPRSRVLRSLVAIGVSLTVACLAAIWWLSPGAVGSQLPPTPRAWLDAYEAAAIDNPSRVCTELFAPKLAQAYGKALHGSCTNYFKEITSFSVVVRRVLQDGDTAVLELRQTVRPRDWAVVLNREPHGWRAVDLLAGQLAR